MKYRLKVSMTIDSVEDMYIKIIPKGTILEAAAFNTTLYECKDPVMCIGITWIENNPHIFEEIK